MHTARIQFARQFAANDLDRLHHMNVFCDKPSRAASEPGIPLTIFAELPLTLDPLTWRVTEDGFLTIQFNAYVAGDPLRMPSQLFVTGGSARRFFFGNNQAETHGLFTIGRRAVVEKDDQVGELLVIGLRGETVRQARKNKWDRNSERILYHVVLLSNRRFI